MKGMINYMETRDLFKRLYKAAKKHDADIQKHFNDSNLTDEQYFLYGVSDDLMVNTITILINFEIKNMTSVGVDNSARAIIEALSLLNMLKEDKISPLELEIYRYQYSLVDKENLATVFKAANLGDDIYDRQIHEDKEKAISLYAQKFNMSVDDLKRGMKQKKYYLGDPLAFLLDRPDGIISLYRIIKDNCPYESIKKLYTFFSITDHPRYEHDEEVETEINILRSKFVGLLLGQVVEFFNANKFFIKDDDKLTDVQQDLYQNEELKGIDKTIKIIHSLFDELIEELCIFEDGKDNTGIFFLEKTRSLIIDMIVSLALGYNEQTIAKFRPFTEYISTFVALNSAKDQEEMIYLKKGFWYNSRIQLDTYISGVVKGDKLYDKTALKEIYEGYYKNKYHLDSLDSFMNGMKRSALYFIDPNRKNYKHIVREYVDTMDNVNHLAAQDYLANYRISIDISHAGGYSFDSSPIIIEIYAIKSILNVWEFLLKYVMLNSLTLQEHGYEVNVQRPISVISEFIKHYTSALAEINNKEIEA